MGLRVEGYRVSGIDFGVCFGGMGFGIWSFGCWVSGVGFRVQGLGFRVWGWRPVREPGSLSRESFLLRTVRSKKWTTLPRGRRFMQKEKNNFEVWG